MSYKIYKNNRRIAKNSVFFTYEEARQYVRKQLRKLTKARLHGQPATYMDTNGYRIRKSYDSVLSTYPWTVLP